MIDLTWLGPSPINATLSNRSSPDQDNCWKILRNSEIEQNHSIYSISRLINKVCVLRLVQLRKIIQFDILQQSQGTNMSIKTNCVRKRVQFFLNNDRLSDVKFVDANSNGESKQVIPAHKFVLAAIALRFSGRKDQTWERRKSSLIHSMPDFVSVVHKR